VGATPGNLWVRLHCSVLNPFPMLYFPDQNDLNYVNGPSRVMSFASAVVLLLAGVFVWAAVAKLSDRRATTRAFAGLGLPSPGNLAVAVPAVEIALAVILVLFPRVGAMLAAGLLISFSLLLWRAKTSNPTVRCGCFGAADDEPVTWVTFVRNGVLVGASMFAATFAAITISTSQATSGLVLKDLIASITAAATLAMIGSIGLALLNLRRTVGAVFSQQPDRAHTSTGASTLPATEATA
jgi:uncharacterized membrane protein YphA (DoxX/SURF4 family)